MYEIKTAKGLLREGKKVEARELLTQFVKEHPNDIDGWYLLSFAVEQEEHAIYCLEKVLSIEPLNDPAIKRLNKIRGVAIPPAPAQAAQPQPVVLEVKEKKRNPIVTILAIVGVLALLCFCGPALIVAIVSPDTFDEVISNEGISSETTVPASPTTAVEPTLPPDFTEIYRFSGNGRGTTDLFSLQDGIIRVKWTHVGESNFALELHRLDDDSYESLENTIGNAEGQAILKVKASDQYLFEAYWADGPWEVIVEYRP